jgi:hypothetical protein
MTAPLPPLMAHPKSHIGDDWTEKEIMVIEAFAKLAVREALLRVAQKHEADFEDYEAGAVVRAMLKEYK